jgi:hypothetical protein
MKNVVNEREFDDLDPLDRLAYKHVRKNRWRAPFIIPKSLYDEPMEALVDAFLRPDSVRPTNDCIYGNTDGGKTTFLKHAIPSVIKVVKMVAEEEKRSGATELHDIDIDSLLTCNVYSIIRIHCHTNTTLMGIEKGLLSGLNWTYLKNDRIYELETMLKNAVKKQKCRLFVIDEFSQLYNLYEDQKKKNGVTQRQADVLQALRNIAGITERPIIVVGVKRVLKLLNLDSESSNRFNKIEFPGFNLDNGGGVELRQFLFTLDRHLEKTTNISSDFNEDPEIIERIFLNSKGRIGAIVKIFEKTVDLALKTKMEALTKELMEEATTQLIEKGLLMDEEDPKHVYVPAGWDDGLFDD